MTPLRRHDLPLSGGARLALWEQPHRGQLRGQVFLTHGTFSTKRVCLGMAEALAEAGYRSWILEWRDHGDSTAPSGAYDFETIAREDVTVALHYLLEERQLERLHGITHSGGGIVLTLALLYTPAYRQRFDSLTFFACQAFGAAHNRTNRAKIWWGRLLSRLLGYTPRRAVGGEQHESPALMQQWFGWNLSGRFLGRDGTDYAAQLATIRVPILSLCGEGDAFIAPVEGCRRYLDAFNNPDNRLLYCSVDGGFAEAYTHSRLMRSRAARRELYPRVLAWMQQWAH